MSAKEARSGGGIPFRFHQVRSEIQKGWKGVEGVGRSLLLRAQRSRLEVKPRAQDDPKPVPKTMTVGVLSRQGEVEIALRQAERCSLRAHPFSNELSSAEGAKWRSSEDS